MKTLIIQRVSNGFILAPFNGTSNVNLAEASVFGNNLSAYDSNGSGMLKAIDELTRAETVPLLEVRKEIAEVAKVLDPSPAAAVAVEPAAAGLDTLADTPLPTIQE